MRNCIIIPGKPSKEEYYSPTFPSPSNYHWFPWIQKQLVMKGIITQVLEMPTPYAPVYEEWKKQLDIYPLDRSYTLVGHSRGAGFLLRYLSERKVEIDALVLVAPSFRPTGQEENKSGEFYSFVPDPSLSSRVRAFHLLYSHNDPVKGIKESAEQIQRWYLQLVVHEFTDKGHFTVEGMPTQEFPELLEIIVG